MRAPPTLPRPLKWLGIALGFVAVLGVILANLPNWNALRGPLARAVGDKTGRQLNIGGDLEVRLGWPLLHVHASDVTFSNPAWAREKNMVEVGDVALGVAVPPLFRLRLVFDEVHLDRAGVNLEKSQDGRKNWLLDRNQRDDKARVVIRRLAIRDGRIDYRDPALRTHLAARISTSGQPTDSSALPLQFRVEGHYKGQQLTATGTGDSVLALRDGGKPYRLSLGGRIGSAAVRANGHVTDLLKLSAVDLQIALRGDSLAQLYPVLGIVFPDTPPYTTRGRLARTGTLWRYEKFHGRIGSSDIAGTLQVDTGSPRPFLAATLNSTRLDFSDLGPLVGTRDTQHAATRTASTQDRVLPAAAFRTRRWPRMDADVTLNAQSVERPDALPIDHLSTRLRLNDAVLRLDPLKFDVAGGTLAGTVKLDGRKVPITAAVDLKARSMKIARLFPTADLNKTSIGELNGDIELAGEGDTVAAMLDNADGQLAMVVEGGIISKLMMEAVSLHLLEMLQLKLSGDETIRIRCGVADFGVKEGIMQARTLIFDTDIVRIDGSGRIDLRQEKFDLRIVPRSKKLSLVALRTPIHLEGRFSRPELSLDKGRLAMRGLAAVGLGAVNPALGLIPLIETRTAADSECRRLIAETDVRA